MRGYLFPVLVDSGVEEGALESPAAMLSKSTDATRFSVPFRKRSPWVLLDFGAKVSGYLFLQLDAGSGDSFLLEYGPTRESTFLRRTVRMPVPGALWMDHEFLSMRYVRVSAVCDSEMPMPLSASVRMLGLRTSACPVSYRGDFRSTDPDLERIWRTGAYTNHLCIQPSKLQSSSFARLSKERQDHVRTYRSPHSKYVLIDGPRRDREAWIGDIRTQALAVYSAFGDDAPVKASLELFYELQREDGSIPGSGASWQEFREYNLWWAIAIWEHFLFTGDRDFLARMYPGVRNLVDWLRFHMDDRGFMWNNASWLWTFPRESYSSAFQCILKKCLESLAAIEEAMDDPDEAADLRATAARIARNIDLVYWDEERGIYRDDLNIEGEPMPVLQDANAYAVTCGVASPEKAARISDYLRRHMWTEHGSTTMDKRITTGFLRSDYRGHLSWVRNSSDPQREFLDSIWPHNRQIWPFINGYEVEAHFLAGRPEAAMELIRRCWGGMLRHGATTFWEMVDAETGDFAARSFQKFSKEDCMNSASHGWSGWVSHLLQTHVLGISPAAPGFATFRVAPCPGTLPEVSGRMPTPSGTIRLKVAQDAEAVHLTLEAPEGLVPVFDFRRLGAGTRPVSVNGRPVDSLEKEG